MSTDLKDMLRSPRKREFQSAVDALQKMPRDRAIEILDELCIEENPEYRCRGLDALVKISPHLAESVGLQMLGDKDGTVRWGAVYWLCMLSARSGGRKSVPSIARVLKADPDELVRSFAAFTLGEIGDSSVLPVLEEAAANDKGKDHEGVPISSTARRSIDQIKKRTGT